MGKSERRKGASGELEVAAIFREAGFDCNRTPNSGALRIRGDLYGDVPAHVEVKRQEVARPWAWFEQAQGEAEGGAIPVVAFRRSRSPWLAIVPLEALVALMAAAAPYLDAVPGGEPAHGTSRKRPRRPGEAGR